jgi:hypothetical protein
VLVRSRRPVAYAAPPAAGWRQSGSAPAGAAAQAAGLDTHRVREHPIIICQLCVSSASVTYPPVSLLYLYSGLLLVLGMCQLVALVQAFAPVAGVAHIIGTTAAICGPKLFGQGCSTCMLALSFLDLCVLVVATGASNASTGVAGCALASVVVSTATATITGRVTRHMSQASTDQLSGPTGSQVKRKRGDNGGDIDDIDTSATGDSETTGGSTTRPRTRETRSTPVQAPSDEIAAAAQMRDTRSSTMENAANAHPPVDIYKVKIGDVSSE